MLKRVVLVTGGAGYIGSHTVVELIKTGFHPIIIDNLSNSYKNIIDRIKKTTNLSPDFYEGDIRDTKFLKKIFQSYNIYAVMHFAGLKSVRESSVNPMIYYDNNVYGSISLIKAMYDSGVNKIIFSSSATVYGKQKVSVYDEKLIPSPINTYGKTKLIVENILNDIKRSEAEWSIANLRYFNPAGADSLGYLGENNKKSQKI